MECPLQEQNILDTGHFQCSENIKKWCFHNLMGTFSERSGNVFYWTAVWLWCQRYFTVGVSVVLSVKLQWNALALRWRTISRRLMDCCLTWAVMVLFEVKLHLMDLWIKYIVKVHRIAWFSCCSGWNNILHMIIYNKIYRLLWYLLRKED